MVSDPAKIKLLRKGWREILRENDKCPQAQWIVELAREMLEKSK